MDKSTEAEGQKKEETAKSQSSESSAQSVEAIKKDIQEKMELEQELAKARAKIREYDKSQQETSNQLTAIQQQFEELKKKSMSKEELEAEEKRQLAQQNEKLKETAAKLEFELKQKSIEVTRVKVAHEENIPADLLDLVTGNSDEEIRSRAKKLASHIKAQRSGETVVVNEVKEVGNETSTKEGVQAQGSQTEGKKPQTFAEVRARLMKQS